MKLRHALAVAICAVSVSAVAHAEDWSLSTWHAGPRSSVAYESSSVARDTRMRRATIRKSRVVRHKRVEHRQEPEVRLYRADEKTRRHVQCLDRVTVVGSQWATEAGAEEGARKSWMEQARWALGEVYMSIENAEGYAKRCSRSSIGEVVGQSLHRCEVSARPCRQALAVEK